MSDRTVHATNPTSGTQIVRYDRAGEWWIEHQAGHRRPLTLDGAVEIAVKMVELGGTVLFGKPGGRTFDARVRRHV